MSYQSFRKKNLTAALDAQIGAILNRFKPGEPTVVLLPGGMGSELKITDRAYRNRDVIEIHRSDAIWIDLGIADDDATALTISANRDHKNKVVFPNGPLNFLALEPYVHLKNFIADDKGWNFITFAYDWRRTLGESAQQLRYFLSELQRRVVAKFGEQYEPLADTTLCCHSMGGNVALTFINQLKNEPGQTAAKVSKWFNYLITIGTPFYGTSTHIDRYYEGIDILETFYSPEEMTAIVGSLPGPYTLLYLPKRIFDRHQNAFANDKYPLNLYPMRDGVDTALAADAYDPAYFSRFPSSVDTALLLNAEQEIATASAKLPKKLAEKIFNIRSGLEDMDIAQKWRSAPRKGRLSPIERFQKGAGDGTVPAWSAKLTWLDDSRVYNTRYAAEHSSLPDHREVHLVIQRIITSGDLPKRVRKRTADHNLFGRPASKQRVDQFFVDVAAGSADQTDKRFKDPAIWRRVMMDGCIA